MGISYYKKTPPLNIYLWARASRILPVYLLALSIVVSIYLLESEYIDSISLILNVTLLQSWVSPHPLSLNTPGWSLSVEAFFYASLPFILYCTKKYSINSVQLGIGALALWIFTNITATIILNNYYRGSPSFAHDMVFYFPMTHLCSFLLGLSGAAWIIEGKIKSCNKVISTLSVVMVISAIVLILNNKDGITHFFGLKKLTFGSSLLSPIFLLLIIAITLAKSSLIKVLSFYPLVLLGEASYSMYILQKPMHLIYEKYLSEILLLGESLDFYAFFVFLVTVSVLTLLLFEKPVNKFLRSRSKSRRFS